MTDSDNNDPKTLIMGSFVFFPEHRNSLLRRHLRSSRKIFQISSRIRLKDKTNPSKTLKCQFQLLL